MDVVERLCRQSIETPSWGYGNAGTRFQVFASPGAARNVWEKIEDAAMVHRLTGIAPRVALHIPWDQVEDWSALKAFAEERGIGIGAINPNLFQEPEYMLGSLAHPESRVRAQALAHLEACLEEARALGASVISLWLADGTNYAGQDDFRSRKARLRESLKTFVDQLQGDERVLLEYKFFEPGFYHTDLADWGIALLHCQALGPRAQVLVDLGHHPQATNVEWVVANLLDEERLGGFHFNARRYADDDLIVGSVNPFELFCIYVELVKAEQDPKLRASAEQIVYMIDQSPNIEPKLEAMILSLLNCQEALAKALLVDLEALRQYQQAGDVLGAHRVLMEAYRSDVRPLLKEVREALGVPQDPIAALKESGYLAHIEEARRA